MIGDFKVLRYNQKRNQDFKLTWTELVLANYFKVSSYYLSVAEPGLQNNRDGTSMN